MNGFHRLHKLRMENDAARYLMDEQRGRFESLKNRHENGTAPRAISVFQLFQTPEPIARLMADKLGPQARVLEPSAGLGRLLDALPAGTKATAIEQASECTGELFRQNREDVQILQRDFLTVRPEEIGLFDGVLMNPPFHLRADIRHIEHALDFLKPGGKLVALCLCTDHRRKAFAVRAREWIDLPSNSFKETGTRVDVSLIVL